MLTKHGRVFRKLAADRFAVPMGPRAMERSRARVPEWAMAGPILTTRDDRDGIIADGNNHPESTWVSNA